MQATHQYDFEAEAGTNDAEKQQEKKEPLECQDAFGDEEFAEVKYKVLSWWYVLCPQFAALWHAH